MSAVDQLRPAAPRGVKPTFLDPELQQDFARRGFATAPLLSRGQAAAALAELEALRPDPGPEAAPPAGGFTSETSFNHPDLDYRRRVHEYISCLLGPPLDKILDRYAPLIGTYITKPAGRGGVGLHCDWTWSADREDVNVNVWCPLVDIDERNGPLRLVPGSHRLVDQIAAPQSGVYWSGYAETVMARSVPILLRAGEAVIFDSSMPHWSPPNRSGATRPAISLTCVAPGATAAFYKADRSAVPARFEMIDMSGGGYFERSLADLRAGGATGRGLGFVEDPNRPLPRAEFERLLARRGFAAGAGDGRGAGTEPPAGMIARLRALFDRVA